jgi:hypothetical protein
MRSPIRERPSVLELKQVIEDETESLVEDNIDTTGWEVILPQRTIDSDTVKHRAILNKFVNMKKATSRNLNPQAIIGGAGARSHNISSNKIQLRS